MARERSSQAGVALQGRLRLWLVGHFRLTTPKAEVAVGDCGARLLALLALRDGRITRCCTAGTLWPEASDDHAQGSLRSALRRLPAPARRAVDVTGHDLSLAAGVEVDLDEDRSLAFRLLDPTSPTRAVDLGGEAMRHLSGDLLPDWYEDGRPEAAACAAASTPSRRSGGSCRHAASARRPARHGRRAGRSAARARAGARRVYLAEGDQSMRWTSSAATALIRAELDLEPRPARRPRRDLVPAASR